MLHQWIEGKIAGHQFGSHWHFASQVNVSFERDRAVRECRTRRQREICALGHGDSVEVSNAFSVDIQVTQAKSGVDHRGFRRARTLRFKSKRSLNVHFADLQLVNTLQLKVYPVKQKAKLLAGKVILAPASHLAPVIGRNQILDLKIIALEL